jgi:hypothetical protein
MQNSNKSTVPLLYLCLSLKRLLTDVSVNSRLGSFHIHFRVFVILIAEDTAVTLKCRTTIKAMFLLNFHLCPCADVIEYVIEQDIIVRFMCSSC